LKAWNSHYIRRPTDPELLPLFRSLEVAFEASRFPSDGLSSINDAGTRIGLWVSAFEVLFHPGHGRRVNKHVVQQELARMSSYTDRRLTRLTYTYEYNGSHRTNFAGVIYDEMYRARDDFMHGNPVTQRNLRLRRSRRYAPLWVIAPVEYNIALRAYMKSMFAMPDEDQRDDSFYGRRAISNALLNVRSGRTGRRR
jgi:hypothetical protein